jgi:acyl dehydratase
MTRRFDDVAVGDPLPELRRVVTREDVRAYAEASGDRNPLHLDDDVARSAGFEGVIAHGMFTMGHMSAAVVSWAGDPAAVTAIDAQFRAPVPLGVELVAGGRVRSLDPETGSAELELWVTFDGDDTTEAAVKRGTARVTLA